MRIRSQWLGLLLFCVTWPVFAARLNVDLGHGARSYTTAELLARPDVRTVTIPADIAFKRSMRYRALPLRVLLTDLEPTTHVQFVGADGFATEIDGRLLLKTGGAQAWLAIEDPSQPWPALERGEGHAGPFYLVWTDPSSSHIGSEQWPYQVEAIRALRAVDNRFPSIVPDATVPADSDIRHGFAAFQRTCFACHTLNGQGDVKLGPDLNIPHNPTEYLRDDLLRAFIRDPQTLRHWPQAKMHGLDKNTLPDADLDAVLAYLRYMEKHKMTP
ncbi:cytochrome c [Rhodanobacter sp. L36]|uniref:c-type cytochrome n=1 Tax=Rhodanobacter sp. L36 TaxID=1747221 RepID=UPI00131D2DBD|nr:cytochrome c [Rhodanobacter sp. L36]